MVHTRSGRSSIRHNEHPIWGDHDMQIAILSFLGLHDMVHCACSSSGLRRCSQDAAQLLLRQAGDTAGHAAFCKCEDPCPETFTDLKCATRAADTTQE